MPREQFCQIGFVVFGLLLQLFDARLVLGAAHAGGDGDDVFGAKNFGGDALEINLLGGAHGFLGQAAGGKKLDGKTTEQKMFALDLPALRLQMRVDGGDAGSQAFVFGDEKNVRVVGRERLDV